MIAQAASDYVACTLVAAIAVVAAVLVVPGLVRALRGTAKSADRPAFVTLAVIVAVVIIVLVVLGLLFRGHPGENAWKQLRQAIQGY